MADFRLEISEKAVQALVNAARAFEEGKESITKCVADLKTSFDDNKDGLAPVPESLKQLIEDLEDETTSAALKPITTLQKELLYAAKWRAEQLDNTQLGPKVKKLTYTHGRGR